MHGLRPRSLEVLSRRGGRGELWHAIPSRHIQLNSQKRSERDVGGSTGTIKYELLAAAAPATAASDASAEGEGDWLIGSTRWRASLRRRMSR
eukprot:COSAG06_NODE_16432_length_1002_cov_0.677741_1_plen_91_part_10